MKAQRQNSTCSQGNICENVHWYIVIAKGRGGRREGRKKKSKKGRREERKKERKEKIETTKISINRKMDKLIWAYSCY